MAWKAKAKKKEKYKRPEQVAEDENDANFVTNQGNTVTQEGVGNGVTKTPTNGKVDSFGDRSRTSKNSKPQSRKRNDDTESDSSETSDSSSESDESEDHGKSDQHYGKIMEISWNFVEEDQRGYQKSSTKAYKNKHGGTTLVSKKVIVGGNYMKISGGGAQNIVLNIDSSNRSSKKPYVKNTGTRYEPYNQKTKKDFHKWRQNSNTSWGNFIYLSEASHVRLEGADVLELKRMCMGSVCRIQYRTRSGEIGHGSGFRIGPPNRKYICTASHVVREIVNSQGQSIFDRASSTMNQATNLENRSVFSVFNHNSDDYSPTDRDKFYFNDIIHFEDLETDVAILELKDNEFGTPLPQPFAKFNTPDPTLSFHLIGHPGGGKKVTCKSENIINMHDPVTSNHINNVRRWCSDNNYVCEASTHHTMDNPARWLFHVADGFTKGASGCPGLVIMPPYDVRVVTVLLRGYPDGYYDRDMPPDLRFRVPKGYLVEQGANMEFVLRNMNYQNPNLCSEIFGI